MTTNKESPDKGAGEPMSDGQIAYEAAFPEIHGMVRVPWGLLPDWLQHQWHRKAEHDLVYTRAQDSGQGEAVADEFVGAVQAQIPHKLRETHRISLGVISNVLEAAERVRRASSTPKRRGTPEPGEEANRTEYEIGLAQGWSECLDAIAAHPPKPAQDAAGKGVDEAYIETAQKFFLKYALGSKRAPSCFGCGSAWKTWEGCTQHLELPDIYLCAECAGKCKNAKPAQVGEREPLVCPAGFCERHRVFHV